MGSNISKELEQSTKAVNSLTPIFENFYKNPAQKNYDKIRIHENSYVDVIGGKYYMFIISAALKYHFYPRDIYQSKMKEYNQNLSRLMNPTSILSADDLDTLWVLYYCTGEKRFPERVKSVYEDKNQNEYVQSAAKWSYNSHIIQKKLDGYLIQ